MMAIALECVCRKCGKEYAFVHEDMAKRVAHIRCDCGGALAKGRVHALHPSPLEVHRALIELIEAEECKAGELSLARAQIEWERVKSLLRTGIQLRAQLKGVDNGRV